MTYKGTCDASVASVSNTISASKLTYDGACTAITGTISLGSDYLTKNDVSRMIDEVTKPKAPDVSPEVKSTIHHDGRHISITTYDNGFKQSTKNILPDIKDIITYNDRVVIVKFADGTQEKAVLYPDDKFTVEQGISICLTKKLMGGSSIYNKVVEYALDVVDKKIKAKEKEVADAAKAKEDAAKEAKRRAERKAQKKEKYIKTQAEILARAMVEAKKMEETRS